MTALLQVLHVTRDVLRVGIFIVVALLALLCLLAWGVRTRRLNPFGRLARMIRGATDPFLVPVERRVVRLGWLPTSAPLVLLAAAALSGILVLAAFNFLIGNLAVASAAVAAGPSGIAWLFVRWTFAILRLALIVRIIVGWLPISPYSPWIRWSYVLSEPILRPLRNIIPTLGPFDISPIVAFLLLGLLESVLLGALR